MDLAQMTEAIEIRIKEMTTGMATVTEIASKAVVNVTDKVPQISIEEEETVATE